MNWCRTYKTMLLVNNRCYDQMWQSLTTVSTLHSEITFPKKPALEKRLLKLRKKWPRRPTGSEPVKMRSFKQVPGPRGLPVVGTLFDYTGKGAQGLQFNKMFEAYEKRANKYGPIFKEKIATLSTVVISDPEEYAKVIRAEGKYPIRREMEPMAYYRLKKGMGLGLINAQGQEWYKYRRVLIQKMLKPLEVLQYVDCMNDVATDFVEYLHGKLTKNRQVAMLEKEIFKWALESIGAVLFDHRIGCLSSPAPPMAQSFIDNLLGYFKCMQPLMYNVPVYKMFRTKLWKRYEQYADNVIANGRLLVNKKVESLKNQIDSDTFQKGDDKDDSTSLLTYLLSQNTLTPEEANSTAVDLLMGAVETTSTAVIWALYCLARHPEIQEELFADTERHLDGDSQITAVKLGQMSYVKAVLKETFRIFPITFATSRHVEKDIEIAGYIVPAGAHVQANLYGMGRNPKLFPNPEEFKPERWLANGADLNNFKAFSNLIWGHGPRMCIGRRFAEQEIYMLLSKIVQKYRLEYHQDDVEPVLNTIMTPDRPVRITFVAREKDTRAQLPSYE